MSPIDDKVNKSATFDQTSLDSSELNKDVEKGGEDAASFVSRRTKPFVALVACAAALGGLIFGYDIVSKQRIAKENCFDHDGLSAQQK